MFGRPWEGSVKGQGGEKWGYSGENPSEERPAGETPSLVTCNGPGTRDLIRV